MIIVVFKVWVYVCLNFIFTFKNGFFQTENVAKLSFFCILPVKHRCI